jgi:AAA ATPase domain
MKIVKLTAENFKRLKAVEITPQGNVIPVTGANEQGKTSVLDAIWAALGVTEMSRATGTTKAIRNGEKKAVVRLDIGAFIVTRKWTDAGSTLSVESSDGAKYGSPQTILDGLVGKVAIDPLSFASMEEKKQRDLLLKLVNLSINLEETSRYRAGAYDKRTDINRNIKHLESQLVALPIIPEGTPDDEINPVDILKEQEAAQKVKVDNDKRRDDAKEARGQVAFFIGAVFNKQTEIEELKAATIKAQSDLEELKQKQESAEKVAEKLDIEVKSILDPDMSFFKKRLEETDAVNKVIRQKKQGDDILKQIEALRKEADVYTAKIETIDKQKMDALTAAKFPIEHLSISDDGVIYKGVPFSQCSSAERLRVSIAVAMAMSPKLRVIRITDGSLIDSKNMAVITEMAKDNDFQVWLEVVDESGKVGVVIEDGEVKAVN